MESTAEKNIGLMPQQPGNTVNADLSTDESAKATIPLTAKQQTVLVQQLVSRFNQWQEDRQPLEAKWRECWDAYLCHMDNFSADGHGAGPDRSRVMRPVLYEAVEGIHANLVNALLPSDERFFSVLGKRESDHQHAEIIEAFLRNRLEDLGFSERYAQFLKQAIITGNSVAAVPWVQRRRRQQVVKPVEVLGVPVGERLVEEEVLTYNGPEFDVIDMFNFYVDPNATRFEDAMAIHRLERPLRYIQNLPEVYTNTSGLEGMNAESHSATHRTHRGNSQRSTKTVDAVEPMVELLEIWGDFVVGKQTYENYVCVVANGERLIRFEPNPYHHGMKPFVFTGLIPVPNEIYGIGAIEKCLGLQHAINTLTNQKLDVINISINNPFTYLINDDVFDPNTVVTRPGALIPVKNHDTLKPIQYLNNFTVAFDEIADLKGEVEHATGALKYLTGAGGSGHGGKKTATEIQALVSGGAQKINGFINHLENTSLEPFLEMVFASAKQFMTTPETVRLAGKNGDLSFVEILPNVLRQLECQFKIEGSQAALNKGEELNKMVTFIQLVQQQPELADKVDLLPLLKKVYRRLGFNDEDVVFNNAHSSPTNGEG